MLIRHSSSKLLFLPEAEKRKCGFPEQPNFIRGAPETQIKQRGIALRGVSAMWPIPARFFLQSVLIFCPYPASRAGISVAVAAPVAGAFAVVLACAFTLAPIDVTKVIAKFLPALYSRYRKLEFSFIYNYVD